jgi:hypothetical protein
MSISLFGGHTAHRHGDKTLDDPAGTVVTVRKGVEQALSDLPVPITFLRSAAFLWQVLALDREVRVRFSGGSPVWRVVLVTGPEK